ncbi:MAG: hypothetical protein IAC77_02645 [Proteobacteria bacterium]|uniref:Uncharacterized protein n=1 Tax=Candidatus Enterousia excrementavium TaxID=2840789 RepID=A0A940DGQ6_9PROT|nr:hypothetical protein [Candidatus Enterousia excrementavium]
MPQLSRQNGNFLLQALLALALIFSFIPFFAGRLASRDLDSQMYAATQKVEVAQTAAQIFVRENANDLPYNTTKVSGNTFSDLLESYGLPLGFVPRTALGQDISLVINKTPLAVTAYLELSGGDLSPLQLAELARRIGFYASVSGDIITVGLALDAVYSDVVRRNESDLNNSAFLTDLDMGGYTFDNGGEIFARRGEFETAQIGTLSVFGVENGRDTRNNIESMAANLAVFQSSLGESALSLTRGALHVNNISARTLSQFGDTGNFTSNAASAYDFAMTAGRTSFYGPLDWTVGGDVISENINFSVERLDIDSYIDASRGQDVYIDPDELEVSSRTGIEASTVIASNITMRDQTSDALNSGETGLVILDIRPSGTSVLPDVLLDGINNDAFEILAEPTSDSDKTESCRDVIAQLDNRVRYNAKSLSQYLVCQYIYWQRLEQRIDMKQCLLEGGTNCD